MDKTFAELNTLLSGHLMPKPLLIAERFRFWDKMQEQGETIPEYAAELRRLSNTCEFPTNFFDEALRDKFVHGMSHSPTQKALLTKDNSLTFQKALDTAIAIELAEGDSRTLRGAASNNDGHSVNRVQFSKNRNQKGNFSNRNKPQQAARPEKKCYRCGKGTHNPNVCKYKQYKCNKCGVKGHLAAVCRNTQAQSGAQNQVQQPSANYHVNVQEVDVNETSQGVQNAEQDDPIGLYSVNVHPNESKSVKPILLSVSVNQVPLEFELDTGAAYTIVPRHMYEEKLNHVNLQPSNLKFDTYSDGGHLPLLGEAMVDVEYDGQKHTLLVVVADIQSKTKPAVFGRNWLSVIKLNWESLFRIMHTSELDKVLDKHPSVFKPGVGEMTIKAKLYVKPGAKPRFNKARPVPYALREQLETEYKRLQDAGILIPVAHAEWAAPVVPVVKTDKSIRVCGDFKVSINESLIVDKYPLPNPQDLFAALSGGKFFTKLDLTQAYQQMSLSEESRKYVTINTHMGLFKYTRLPYGVASAPSIFQSAMEQILQGIDGVLCYLDDILITGATEHDHLQRLDLVLQRLY
jgi:hypothetical protein